MKKEIKLINVGKDTVVGMGFVGSASVGSAVLDAKEKNVRQIEREMTQRFLSQIHQKRLKGENIPNIDRGEKWVIRWYDYSDVSKAHTTKENVMEAVCGKPKIYSIEKKLDGSLKVNKVEGKLYDEDELKVVLCKMALGD